MQFKSTDSDGNELSSVDVFKGSDGTLHVAGETLTRKRTREPGMATLERWMDTGRAKATDGCTVEPDGYCPHGCPSWLIELGLI